MPGVILRVAAIDQSSSQEQPVMVAWHHDEGQKLVAFVREMEKRILNNLRLPFIFQMSDWWIMVKKIVH